MLRMNQKRGEITRGDSALAVKAGFWYVISSFLVKSVSFLTTPLFARLMSQAEYGEFTNFASWQVTLLIITGMELHNTVNRAYYDFKEDYDSYISTVTILAGIVTATVYVIFLLCGDFIYNIVAIPKQYVHLMFVLLLFQSCKQIFMSRERTLYRYKTVAVISFVSVIVPTLLSVLLVMFVPDGNRLSLRLYGFYGPLALVGVCCAVSLLRRGIKVKRHYSKYAFALAIPLLAHYLTAYLLASTNTIVTKSVLGAEATAVVSIANSVLHILTVFFHAVSGAITTWLMDNLEKGDKAKIRKDSLFYVLLLAVLSVGVVLIAPEIVQVLGGTKYAVSTALVPGFVLSVFIQSVGTIFTIILTYDKNITKTAIFTGIVAVLSIVAKVALLPVFGQMVLPWINVTAFAVLFGINYLLVRRAGYAGAVDLKKIIAIILALGILVGCSSLLYANTLVRYGIIAVCVVVFTVLVIRNKTAVLAFIKKMRKAK